jgi:drug/metabolite transporter (DMT)-like permease
MSGLGDKISPENPGLRGWLLLGVALFLILVWGSAFTMVGVAVRTLSPEWLVAYRMTVGAIVVLIYSYSVGHRLPPLRDSRWIWYFIMAVTGASLPFVLLAHGQQTVDSGLTAIIVGTMPLITIVLAHFFTPERLTAWKLIGFLMGFAGIVVLFLPKDLSFAVVADWKAQLLILFASACYAITTIVASRTPETPSPVGAAMMLMIGAALSTVWASVVSGPPPMPNMTALLCVLGLGLGSTAIATMTYLWVIDVAGPSVMARINYFVPVCSVILGVALLDEALDWRIFVALFVILLGVIISRYGEPTKAKTQAP